MFCCGHKSDPENRKGIFVYFLTLRSYTVTIKRKTQLISDTKIILQI
ncbi:hypothetical protein ENTCAN_08141 [Enterobacter cancerogenus ATCC 35316]|nr:hypothetical protein ENTCAN_08141 [Enterobacter cancerogenus ATCC 35316]